MGEEEGGVEEGMEGEECENAVMVDFAVKGGGMTKELRPFSRAEI